MEFSWWSMSVIELITQSNCTSHIECTSGNFLETIPQSILQLESWEYQSEKTLDFITPANCTYLTSYRKKFENHFFSTKCGRKIWRVRNKIHKTNRNVSKL